MPELEFLLPISTAHAPSAEALDAAISEYATMSRPEGALFFAGRGSIRNEMPDWLIGLIIRAQNHGAVWLLLDCDADTVDDLPAYDW